MRRPWLVIGTAAVLVAGGGAAYVGLAPAGTTALPVPTTSPTPEPVRTPLLVARTAATPPTGAGMRRALATAIRDPALGRLGLSIVDAASGQPVLEIDAGRASTPASTAKIITAVAALSVLEPTATLDTRLVAGTGGDLVLVGGGDPTLEGAHPADDALAGARLATLAAAVRGRVVTRVVVDDSAFTGPRLGPGWKPGYVSSGDVAPVSALSVDAGRTGTGKSQPRVQDPALEAGRQLAALLRIRTVVRGVAPRGAQELARVSSPPITRLVESMLTRSDNDLAEALGRQVALAGQLPATFEGESAAVEAAVAPLRRRGGLPSVGLSLRDASGLSPLDAVQPAVLARLLAVTGTDDRFGPVLAGLPVAGFDGTLAKRYRTAPTSSAAGEVRAKTGTLNGVSALAGLATTDTGAVLAFALTANGFPISGTLAAQAALDRIAATLVGCGCP